MEDNQGKVKNLYLIRATDGNMFAGIMKDESNNTITLNDVMIFSQDEDGNSFIRPDPLTQGRSEFQKENLVSVSRASDYLITTYMKVKAGADLKDLIKESFPEWNISYAVH